MAEAERKESELRLVRPEVRAAGSAAEQPLEHVNGGAAGLPNGGTRQTPRDEQGGGNGGRPWSVSGFSITSRVVQGVVMLALGVALGVLILSEGDGSMQFLTPVLIGALALSAQGVLFVVTVGEERRHDRDARRKGGLVQMILGFVMAFVMLVYEGGDVTLVWVGYLCGFLLFVSGWRLYFQRPVSLKD